MAGMDCMNVNAEEVRREISARDVNAWDTRIELPLWTWEMPT